jgi:hypothetical protein
MPVLPFKTILDYKDLFHKMEATLKKESSLSEGEFNPGKLGSLSEYRQPPTGKPENPGINPSVSAPPQARDLLTMSGFQDLKDQARFFEGPPEKLPHQGVVLQESQQFPQVLPAPQLP